MIPAAVVQRCLALSSHFATFTLLCIASAEGPVGPVTALAVCADGTLVACSQAGIAVVAKTWRNVVLEGERPFCVAVVPGKKGTPLRLLVGGGVPGRHGALWIQVDAQTERRTTIADDVVCTVAVHPSGLLAAAGSADGTVWIVDLRDPDAKVLKAVEVGHHAGPCRAVAFSKDGRMLAHAGRDGRVVLLPLEAGEAGFGLSGRDRIECTGHTAGIEHLIFSADGTVVGAALDGRVRRHDRDGRLLRTWQRLGAAVRCVVETEKGLVAGLVDGRILLLHEEREAPTEVIALETPVFSLALVKTRLWAGTIGRVVEVPLP